MIEKEKTKQRQADDEERLKAIDYFLENIDQIQDVKNRNMLYKSILDSVVWRRIGNEEEIIHINFL